MKRLLHGREHGGTLDWRTGHGEPEAHLDEPVVLQVSTQCAAWVAVSYLEREVFLELAGKSILLGLCIIYHWNEHFLSVPILSR